MTRLETQAERARRVMTRIETQAERARRVMTRIETQAERARRIIGLLNRGDLRNAELLQDYYKRLDKMIEQRMSGWRKSVGR